MIAVEFKIEPGDEIERFLESCARSMPWMRYLVDNRIGLYISESHDANTFLNVIRFEFILPEAKETFYRIKYSS